MLKPEVDQKLIFCHGDGDWRLISRKHKVNSESLVPD